MGFIRETFCILKCQAMFWGISMIYFIADTHFCHSNIIGSCGEPCDKADGMDRALIDNWNSSVKDRDEIYILGDFMHKGDGKKANEIMCLDKMTVPQLESVLEYIRKIESD